MARPYDYVFAGAGASALTLSIALLEANPDATALLIDPSLADLSNRTFAFWWDGEPPFAAAIKQTWSQVEVRVPDRQIKATLDRYRYHVIAGEDFRAHCLQRLESTGRAAIVRSSVVSTGEDEEQVAVDADSQRFFGRWLFDSRMEESQVNIDPTAHVVLEQRFVGWDVRTQTGVFDPEVVTLFDFRMPQQGDQRFAYVLPYSDRYALIEHVSLAECDHNAQLAHYLSSLLAVGQYEVVRREAGVSLLTDAPFVRAAGSRTLRIGLAGGLLKPSSGYAFTRIVQDAAAIVESFRAVGHPFDLPAASSLFAELDHLFLKVSDARPEGMAEIFAAMFRYNPPDRVFAFLDEQANADQILSLGLSLPLGPFVRAAGLRFVPTLIRRLEEAKRKERSR